jgi:hypothetical protein
LRLTTGNVPKIASRPGSLTVTEARPVDRNLHHK